MKTIPVKQDDGKITGYMIFCPACNCGHEFKVNHSNPKANWTFDGNLEQPTFSPSMLVKSFKYNRDINGEWLTTGKDIVCHSFVRNGKIEFLGDCTHELKGRTVELPEI